MKLRINPEKAKLGRRWVGLFLLGGCLAAGLGPLPSFGQDRGLPALKIGCSLTWDGAYEDDPLRVRVRLTCPQASRAAALQLRLLEQGQAPGDPVAGPPIAEAASTS